MKNSYIKKISNGLKKAVLTVLPVALMMPLASCSIKENEAPNIYELFNYEQEVQDAENYVSVIDQDFVAPETFTLSTPHFEFTVNEGSYVTQNFDKYFEDTYVAMQEATGIYFVKTEDIKWAYAGTLKDKINVEIHNSDILPQAKLKVHLNDNDLFQGNSSAVVHELAHILHFANSPYDYGQVLTEGFASYVELKTYLYLEENNPELAMKIDSSSNLIGNNAIGFNKNEIWNTPFDEWISSDISAKDRQVCYYIGMLFYSYLDISNQNAMEWIYNFEKKYPSWSDDTDASVFNSQNYINMIKSTYGDDIFDRFYEYQSQYGNEILDKIENREIDYTSVKEYKVYPKLYSKLIEVSIFPLCNTNIKYNDLVLNLSKIFDYFNLKNVDVSTFSLSVSGQLNGIEIYDKNGQLLKTLNSNKETIEISDNIAYIKFTGAGILKEFYSIMPRQQEKEME